MLRAWADRGLVVRGLHTQLLAVREVARTRSTWTLRVTDRLVGGVAVGRWRATGAAARRGDHSHGVAAAPWTAGGACAGVMPQAG